MAQLTRFRFVIVPILAAAAAAMTAALVAAQPVPPPAPQPSPRPILDNLPFFRTKNDDTVKPEWAARAVNAREAAADLAAAALLGLRNVRSEDYDAVRAKYPAVAETCNGCHRTFAREAPTVKP
ncbi:MAG: cytochrome c [Acidobacteria bacterium]|nr:cytochrome c [Acidobacteriota bacterium]